MSVLLVTSLGDIVIDLHTDRCPNTCYNFLKLCKFKYYNNCLFHTIEKNFIAQTGDPTGTGLGGVSIYRFLYGSRFFRDEIHPDLKHAKTGTVAMASAGENLNTSQFYITLRDDIDYLDGKKTVFGEVAEGIGCVNTMNEVYVDDKNRPYKDIRILNTYVLCDPFEDPKRKKELVVKEQERERKDEVDDEVRIEDDEVVGDKEAHSRAVVLECIGDLPYAEIKQPDNVLFVYKLNSETQDEDLKTIFSQFGTVKSCEVIRDYKTGKSLRYGFIEFDDVKACERAYEKMDNTLIDDKRIRVDFSQSVSRVNHVGKGCFKCGSLNHVLKECTDGEHSSNITNMKSHLKERRNQDMVTCMGGASEA